MMTINKTSLKQCIEEISLINTDYKFPAHAINQAESLKSLSSDLYTDNIRFIYELIQNADDAGAKNVILAILENKYLIVAHDGNKCCLFYYIKRFSPPHKKKCHRLTISNVRFTAFTCVGIEKTIYLDVTKQQHFNSLFRIALLHHV
jgi:hypothetical protein